MVKKKGVHAKQIRKTQRSQRFLLYSFAAFYVENLAKT
jgi:hypothetical protein